MLIETQSAEQNDHHCWFCKGSWIFCFPQSKGF